MSTKILLLRIVDPNKLAAFVGILQTIASVKDDCNCTLLVSRLQLKFKIAKNESNLCELLAQIKSIFFDDYKYIAGEYHGHGFLISGLDDIAATIETFRKAVG